MGDSVALLLPAQLHGLDEAAEQLIQTRRAKNTQEAYRRDWARWIAFGVDPLRPSLIDAINFRTAMREVYGPASLSRVLSTLSFFYRAFMSAGFVKQNPFDRAWLPRDEIVTGKTRAVTVDDASRVLEAVGRDNSAAGRRDAAILRLLYDTGARRASIATAKRDDIDLTTNTLRVIVKGGKERFLKFTEDCTAAIDRWLEVVELSPFLFPSPRATPTDPKPINLATVNKLVTARAKAVGVLKLHPHRFRAAFITDAYSAQIPERDIQTAAHHADAAMTRRYDRGVRGESVADKVAEFRKQAKK